MSKRIDIKLQQLQYDGYVSRIGQVEAARYLAAREQPPTRGNIRTALALNVLVVLIIIISMAL